jgi:hypothetical protein
MINPKEALSFSKKKKKNNTSKKQKKTIHPSIQSIYLSVTNQIYTALPIAFQGSVAAKELAALICRSCCCPTTPATPTIVSLS